MTHLKAVVVRLARWLVPPVTTTADNETPEPNDVVSRLSWLKDQEDQANQEADLVQSDPKKAIWTLQQKYTARPYDDRQLR